jgi:hypothetical protein
VLLILLLFLFDFDLIWLSGLIWAKVHVGVGLTSFWQRISKDDCS